MSTAVIGVIGGSGLYDIDGLRDVREHRIKTPFGNPSDALIEGWIGDTQLFFLPRHGRGHRLSPSEINYRANIWALRSVGVRDVLSVSAVGSMREDIAPGDVVVPDQFIDRTVGRSRTFFEGGVVAHVSFAQPISKRVSAAIHGACAGLGIRHHVGGAYVCIEGPQFSTRAESLLFRTWPGVSVIGMTNMPEARLAREAELSYATVAMVTDFDCWNGDHDAVSVEQVIATLHANVEKARQIVAAVAAAPPTGHCPSHDALRHAVMTRPEFIPPDAYGRVALFLDRHMAKEDGRDPHAS